MKSRFFSPYRLARLAILAALCVALRYAFGAFPNVKPITAIFLVTAIKWGLGDSWLVMALTMTVTSFVFGFGPWLAWQLVAYTVILILWKWVAHPLTNALPSVIMRRTAQAILAGCLGMVYGLVADALSALFYDLPIWAYVLNGTPFNLAHALSTALFYPLIGEVFDRLS